MSLLNEPEESEDVQTSLTQLSLLVTALSQQISDRCETQPDDPPASATAVAKALIDKIMSILASSVDEIGRVTAVALAGECLRRAAADPALESMVGVIEHYRNYYFQSDDQIAGMGLARTMMQEY